MRFLQKDKVYKTIIVISDAHLGAGVMVDGKRNCLEDFHHDKELVEFLEYYQSGEYQNREVELVINGDFLDFLSVPYIKYFDDEIWGEAASRERLKLIVKAHREVFDTLARFVSVKKRKIVYILGNYDAELIMDGNQKSFFELFSEDARKQVTIISNDGGQYIPYPGVYIIHGHEYELAHYFHSKKSVVLSENGTKYFLPPWGSYYITRVLNKFREEKSYLNSVKPIRKFLINGLIYDTLFTLRFVVASIYYFIMVRFIFFFKQHKSMGKIIDYVKRELELYRDYEELTEEFFEQKKDVRALLVGHTHEPVFRPRGDGSIFINTGTWTKMFNLDFGKRAEGIRLTYAQIDIRPQDKGKDVAGNEDYLDISLNIWKGHNNLPYAEF